MMKARARHGAMAALALLVASGIGHGRTHAVLVGVSSYPTLDERLQLEGPRNDVEQYRSLLADRGVAPADIRVLADGVRGATEPTRTNILTAFARVAADVAEGDVVFILLAGHGSQQPAKGDLREEPDGLDEIFLPRDVGRWEGEIAAIRNAITDDEIGEIVERIRSRGAFVWVVVDACHSGTITRGMPVAEERDRQVRPELLGVDAEAMRSAMRIAGRTRGTRDVMESAVDVAASDSAKGGFVAFYAAQSHETAPELLLPRYAEDARQRGLFSFALQQALLSHPGVTYRQVIERVLQLYQGMGRNSPTPTYEGTGLDSIVLAGTVQPGLRQWRVENEGGRLILHAGLLHQVTPDSVLALVATPTSKDEEVIGYARVTSATSLRAELTPVAHAQRPTFKPSAIGHSAYARPVDLKVDFLLRVARPAKSDRCEAPAEHLTRAVRALETRKDAPARVRWVSPDEPADVRLCQRKGRLLFLEGSGELERADGAAPPGIAVTGTPETLAAELALHLYVDAAYGITALFPSAREGHSARIPPHARPEFDIKLTAEPLGFERMLVIAVPATPQSVETNFAGLAQSGFAARQRGGATGGLVELFEEAAFGTSAAALERGGESEVESLLRP